MNLTNIGMNTAKLNNMNNLQQPMILRIITHFFSKKFKTRVSHYADCRYVVQWCNYRFIPVWHSLCFWFEQGHPGGTECWSTDIWDYKTAERIASSIKSKKDLRSYYKKFEDEKENWEQEEKEYWKKNAPYKNKIINDI
jgi:hypothetical protein